MADLFSRWLEDANKPLAFESKAWFKAGKIRVIIINEDYSGTIYFKPFPKAYVFEIKGFAYFFVSKCVLNLDFPTIIYFYNNPKPLFLEFQESDLLQKDLYSADQFGKLNDAEKILSAQTYLSAETIKLLMDAVTLRALKDSGFWTITNILLLVGALLVVFLVIMQATCQMNLLNLDSCKKPVGAVIKHLFLPVGPWLWRKITRGE